MKKNVMALCLGMLACLFTGCTKDDVENEKNHGYVKLTFTGDEIFHTYCSVALILDGKTVATFSANDTIYENNSISLDDTHTLNTVMTYDTTFTNTDKISYEWNMNGTVAIKNHNGDNQSFQAIKEGFEHGGIHADKIQGFFSRDKLLIDKNFTISANGINKE